MDTRVSQPPDRLATFAAAAIATWPAVVTALHVLQRDHYDPAHQAISELATGRYGFLMNTAFVVFGLGVFALAVGLRRSVPRAAAGPGLLAAVGLLIVLSGLFPTNPAGTSATTAGRIHMAVGITAFVTVIVAMACCAWRFRRDARWRGFALPTLTWALASLGTFFLVPLEATAFGIAQRLFVATWLSWTLATALRLRVTAPSHPAPAASGPGRPIAQA